MKKYIAIDIGGTYVKYGLITEKGVINKKDKIETERNSFEKFLNDIDRIIKNFNIDIHGICISMPGKVDFKNGIAITGGALRFIDHTPLQEILQNRYHVQVSIANDGHCATLAELWQGSLKNCQNGACIVFGTGIGGGIVINNELIEGTHFASGEFSCLITNYETPDLQHFLGTRCSTRAMLRKYNQKKGTTVDGYYFFNQVRKGNVESLEVYQLFLKEISASLYTIQSIIDCKKIAIGGGISELDFLVPDITYALEQQFDNYIGFPIEKPEIVKCVFENDANLIGALKYHLKKYK